MRKKSPTPDELERRAVQDAITDVQNALSCAYNQFEMTADPALTEAAIYRILALRAHYDYLIRQAKALERRPAPPEKAPRRLCALREVESWG